MPGKIDLGSVPGITPQDMTVYFGARQAQPDSRGDFDIKGNGGTPGLALAVDGDASNKKWVLLVSVAHHEAPHEPATQYFVGDFDGTTFVNACIVDKSYRLANDPVVIDLP